MMYEQKLSGIGWTGAVLFCLGTPATTAIAVRYGITDPLPIWAAIALGALPLIGLVMVIVGREYHKIGGQS